MARTKHYPSDATIADILPDLADSEAYLRQVLITMRMCQKHYGDAWVRIGVTGRSPWFHKRTITPAAIPSSAGLTAQTSG